MPERRAGRLTGDQFRATIQLMRRVLILVVALAGLAAALVLYLRNSGGVYRVRDGRAVSFERMVWDLRSADVVLIGETHETPADHLLQERIIRALHEQDVPLAVGLEMFRADDQTTLDAWVAGSLPEDRFIRRYYDNWDIPWPLYKNIFLYAREHRIPLVGLNIPDTLVDAVAKRGYASLNRKQQALIPGGVTCNVGPRYRKFIREIYQDHAPQENRSFNNFCEAQLLWDESMALHIAGYRAQHKDRLLVVLAGVGHAWRRGIPEQLTKYASLDTRIVLPVLPDEGGPDAVTTGDADYIVSE